MTKILSCAAVLGLLVASSSSVLAAGRGGSMGASSFSPGHEVKTGGVNTGGTSVTSVGGPGASGYAPGRQYIEDRTTGGTTGTHPGASVYAPGFLK